MTEVQQVRIEVPQWAQGRSLDELEFCRQFLLMYPMVYVDGQFYSGEGRVKAEKIRQYVFDYMSPFVRSGLGKKVSGMMETLRCMCRKEALEPGEAVIHCANGDYYLNRDEFRREKQFCQCRLPVEYDPQAPEPELWLSFLRELLEPEDILTLQEFIGYCLVPVNYAQKMLLIIGSGGEGKSRIGIVLQALLGEGMMNGSLAKLESSPFARADLQSRLLMVDDDLRLEALSSTNYLKSIITAEQPMDLEKKGIQSYQGMLHCRLMAFGNGNLRSLHDRSYGFFRRQIILTTKERSKDRVDDPFLACRLKLELKGILQWAIAGLIRLLDQNMCFTLSQRSRENLQTAIDEGNNIVQFLRSKGYVRFDPEAQISSRHLYQLYRDWCEDNMLIPLSGKTVSSWLIQNGPGLGLSYTWHVPGGNGRHVRGFRGLRGDGLY